MHTQQDAPQMLRSTEVTKYEVRSATNPNVAGNASMGPLALRRSAS
jgi:hypothetical protein